jgi:hypothetical protein
MSLPQSSDSSSCARRQHAARTKQACKGGLTCLPDATLMPLAPDEASSAARSSKNRKTAQAQQSAPLTGDRHSTIVQRLDLLTAAPARLLRLPTHA